MAFESILLCRRVFRAAKNPPSNQAEAGRRTPSRPFWFCTCQEFSAWHLTGWVYLQPDTGGTPPQTEVSSSWLKRTAGPFRGVHTTAHLPRVWHSLPRDQVLPPRLSSSHFTFAGGWSLPAKAWLAGTFHFTDPCHACTHSDEIPFLLHTHCTALSSQVFFLYLPAHFLCFQLIINLFPDPFHHA